LQGGAGHENDISAEEASAFKGTRFQKESGYKIRQKGFSCQKKKGQKVFNCVNLMNTRQKGQDKPSLFAFFIGFYRKLYDEKHYKLKA
jgi:hypothetical protein